MKKQIIHVQPVFKERIWGGKLIKTRYNGVTDIEPVGELWSVAAFKDSGDNVLTELNMTLSEAYAAYPELFNVKSEHFPIRCTLMDPLSDLSVQVHPDEAYALKHMNSYGKHEAWLILETGANHELQFGHKAKTREELSELIDERRWKDLLRYETVHAGDFIDVPAGTIHAIAKNMITFEVARHSDITYRLYDYDRLDAKTGKPRDLHLEAAKAVITVPHTAAGLIHPKPVMKEGCLVTTYIDEPGKYTLLKVENDSQGSFDYAGFYFMTFVDGQGFINDVEVKPGDTLLIPAGFGKIALKGKMTALISSYRD